MHLELMRDEARQFPVDAISDSLRTLRVWHCKYRSLAPVSRATALEGLEIATFPDETFDLLTPLGQLRYLHVLHMPRITDLGPLSALRSLETLRLATLPSWDSSGKKTIVDSLEPLVELPALRHLELFGVVPEDRSLAPLERCGTLRTARISKFPRKEMDRFYRATSVLPLHAPEPDF